MGHRNVPFVGSQKSPICGAPKETVECVLFDRLALTHVVVYGDLFVLVFLINLYLYR